MRFDAEIRTAIESRRLLVFEYQSRARTVEPHDYGMQKGRVRLFGYQIAGESSTRLPAWRLFDIDKIERLTISERTFLGSRGSDRQRHHHWDVLFARVK